MKRQINLHNRVVNYSVRRSNRAKRMRLAVYCDGNFIVTVPQTFSASLIDRYVIAKSQWVISKLDFFEGLNKKQKLTFGNDGFELYKDKALEMVTERLAVLNQKHYRLKFNKIAIKSQKTRWGSCSKKRNLNFNYKVLFLPPKIRDYIMIHELCHIKEFNHSRRFWRLVAKSMPDHGKIIEELKIKGLSIS
ncbi:metal-dependent hydrolase [Candidatus Gottesmanbacteria bacterium CG11_big_fil_rev_8_21_14_0_20_37_11]|uniref:Metal-dependent hydrolase n=2 Tax=Candidatus Gottesmaniibacteriota TaxID=1752720 RepID=A0A2M7RS86_9BACT|nr:MAG: metal-dependent hydrolase [Candidatus Gottesmanbacteria bacterium CG23_combo_of_CG06-09_8_20_14_all_37_19]PIR08739.1 MAG: metal-dependent hydrolase [Candidatus Gottesmanbacteria bacterium CG11_big_fil_rev_8_21_14_0_20_37_11]PIZ03163.1 MAG: metal-dependent hydrolase [Candidatus Gottesmanbacteria bacterium CG_4_10_14_0_8_um_filter_37_24]